MSSLLAKLAVREISRRKGQAVLIILGLMISTAVITGSLVVGDSMEYLVYSSTIENLGEVDIVVRSGEFFDYEYYSALSQNTSVQKEVDKLAPTILLPASIETAETKLRENKANLIGINEQFFKFGHFTRASDGNTLDTNAMTLGLNEVIINERLASKLKVQENENVQLFINNPDFTLDTVYSGQQGLNTIENSMTIKYIVEHDGIGRLQLDGRTQDTSNIFMDLTQLQDILGIENMINSILISNRGDKFKGIEHDDDVTKVVGQSLDSVIGYRELGYEISLDDSNYLSLENNDIFFDNDIYELLTEYEQNYPLADGQITSSPMLTYFVNSLTLNRTGRSTNYSIVTGLDISKDQKFGDFEILSNENLDYTHNSIDLAADEIILLNWTAQQLDATVGDKLTLNYMVLDQFYNIYNVTNELTIKYIISLTGKALDPFLMPNFPGLEGTLNCADWDPSFPVNITWITKADRDFWFKHQGTPKAYITLETALQLWENNLGSLTMVKLNVTSKNSTTPNQALVQLKNNIGAHLDREQGYSEAGLTIDHVKSDALATAVGMALFPMMFLTFSSAIILAGIALIITIFLILAEARKSDFGLARAIGLQKSRVVKLYLIEGLIYGVIAGALGVIIGLFLGWSLISALNSIWSSAVEDYSVPFYFKPISLLYGFIAGLVITIITIFITAHHISKHNILSALYDLPAPKKERSRGMLVFGLFMLCIGAILIALTFNQQIAEIADAKYYLGLFGPVLVLLGGSLLGMNLSNNTSRMRTISSLFAIITIIYIIIFAVMTFPEPNTPTMELFFMVGLLLVMAVILVTIMNIESLANGVAHLFGSSRSPLPVARYSLQNPTRRKSRTGLTISIFTLVIFLLASLSINIAIQHASVDNVSYEERGGYDIIGETSVPLSIDLENSSQRLENDIHTQVFDNLTVTEIKLVGPPGGTCSNMNVHYPPRLLGVNHDFVLENAFQFQSTSLSSNEHRKTWRELELTAEENNGRIPIVVDYNTLVWIYSGALGEIYEVEDESGNTVELEVIGVLENTVFGGTFIMSENNLETLYPKTAEYRYALFKLKPGMDASLDQIANELEYELHMYGLDAQVIIDFINTNREYERSFMDLFRAFLGLGLIVGMVGLGVVTARAVSERKYEIGVLRALGFTRKMILKSFLIELSFIGLLAILLGLIVGILSSYLAFGAWTGGSYEFVVPWVELFILALIIYFVALASAVFPAYRASKLTPAEALRRVG